MAARKRIVVELSSELHKWLLRKAGSADYDSPAEYIRHLLRTARENSIIDEIDAELIEADESGSAPMTRKDWDDLVKRGNARAAKIRRSKEAAGARARRKSA